MSHLTQLLEIGKNLNFFLLLTKTERKRGKCGFLFQPSAQELNIDFYGRLGGLVLLSTKMSKNNRALKVLRSVRCLHNKLFQIQFVFFCLHISWQRGLDSGCSATLHWCQELGGCSRRGNGHRAFVHSLSMSLLFSCCSLLFSSCGWLRLIVRWRLCSRCRGTVWQLSRLHICLTAVPLFLVPQQPPKVLVQLSGSVSRSADVFPRAAMMDSCRDLQWEWLMMQRHLWWHWGIDLSSVIYHWACQCQYKCLMESSHWTLSGADTMATERKGVFQGNPKQVQALKVF